MGAVIIGTGSCLPERVLSNQDLEKMVETNDEWIKSRTGISTRRISGKGEETYRLATIAAQRAMEMAEVTADEIDLIIVATITPHMVMPSTACFVQKEVGARNAFAWDLNAACSGFLYSLDTASKHVLVDRDKTGMTEIPVSFLVMVQALLFFATRKMIVALWAHNFILMAHSGIYFIFTVLRPVTLKSSKRIIPVLTC